MKYYTVIYEVDGPDIQKAAWNIAIGQSIGNPNIRSEIETAQNIKDFEATIESIEGNIVKINFPLDAWDWPNLNQLMWSRSVIETVRVTAADAALDHEAQCEGCRRAVPREA